MGMLWGGDNEASFSRENGLPTVLIAGLGAGMSGMPLSARAGTWAQASAAAVTPATTRAAGVARRALIGVLVPLMSAWLCAPALRGVDARLRMAAPCSPAT